MKNEEQIKTLISDETRGLREEIQTLQKEIYDIKISIIANEFKTSCPNGDVQVKENIIYPSFCDFYADITRRYSINFNYFYNNDIKTTYLYNDLTYLYNDLTLKPFLIKHKEIIKDDYELAYREARILMYGIALNVKDLSKFSYQYLDYINNQPTAIER